MQHPSPRRPWPWKTAVIVFVVALTAAWVPRHEPAARTGGCPARANGRTACPRSLARLAAPRGARDQRIVRSPVSHPATLVDTRTWTSGGGNTFPGADLPFGMAQWSPDTLPHRNAGGGYESGDQRLAGYSLTHVSGPGCPAAGDVPILPMTTAPPSGDPAQATTSFGTAGEVAQAGYYSARSNMPETITSQFTGTLHSAVGRFRFPPGLPPGFLVKLDDSQKPDIASSVRIAGPDEIMGSDTSGHFCGRDNNVYTVYFDIVFSHAFHSARIIRRPGSTHPQGVFLRFSPGSGPVIVAKAGISYVSASNAKLNWRSEDPGWDFASVRASAQRDWNRLLGKIQVSGGTYARTQEFYSLLYKSFLEPSTVSDVNGQYLGADMKVHSVRPGQENQYGIFSGWDIYHSLAQLQAMLDPAAAGDMAQSLVNYYSQSGILQRWGYLNQETYAMVGDPADAIIADYYAFGARNFAAREALADMLRQATSVNTIRPGEALEQRYGYLPADAEYGCCYARDPVSTLLENDTADFALSGYAAALGDFRDATMLRNRANNWMNLFDKANGLLTPRLASGAFVTGVTPTTKSTYYIEGDAYQYLWDVPNNYAGLFKLLGGASKVVPALRRYLSQPSGGGAHAQLGNEFDLGEQYALDYAGDPAGAQQAVNRVRNTLYRPGPYGLLANDDAGAESSQYIWEMLGMYPENPGSDVLVFASPGFPQAVIRVSGGKSISISAPGASPTNFYVQSLRIDGRPYKKLFTTYSRLARGARLQWVLGRTPSRWGSAPGDAPPSYGRVAAS